MGFLQYAIVALFVSFGVELVAQYDQRAALWLAVLILLSVLITHTEALEELAALLGSGKGDAL